MSNKGYESSYSDGGFWQKLVACVGKVCRRLLEEALLLYYALQDSDTPLWAKTVIIGALGYFISPLDACPDILPVVGYSDDVLVVGAALATVRAHVKKAHHKQAEEVLDGLFG